METVFDLGKMEDARDYARDASNKLNEYYGSLNKKIKSRMDSYQAVARRRDWNDNVQTAYSMIQTKMKDVWDSKDNYWQYKMDIDAFITKAEGVESRIISQMNDTLSSFCNQYGLEFTPSDENPKKGWFAGLIDAICRKVSSWASYVWKDIKDSVRQWYNYYGGAEIIGAVFAVAMVVVAVIALVVAWPAVAAATTVWATIVAVAGVITATITLLNAVVQLGYAMNAAVDGVQGKLFDSAWFSFKSENGSFTQQLREWGFYDVADVIDIVNTVCGFITFFDGFVKLAANLKKVTGLTKLMDWKHPFKSLGKDFKAITDVWGGTWDGFKKMISQNFKSIYGNGTKKAIDQIFFKKGATSLDYFSKGVKYVKSIYEFATYNDPTGRKKDAGMERFKTLNPITENFVENGIIGGFDLSRTETTTTTTKTETITRTEADGSKVTETYVTEHKETVDDATRKTVADNLKTTDTVSTQDAEGNVRTKSTSDEYGWKQDVNVKEDISLTEKKTYTDTAQTADGNKYTMSGSEERSMSSSGNNTRVSTDKETTTIKSSYTQTDSQGKTVDSISNTSSSSTTKITKDGFFSGDVKSEKIVIEDNASAKNFDGSKPEASSKTTGKVKYDSTGDPSKIKINSNAQSFDGGQHETTAKFEVNAKFDSNSGKIEMNSNVQSFDGGKQEGYVKVNGEAQFHADSNSYSERTTIFGQAEGSVNSSNGKTDVPFVKQDSYARPESHFTADDIRHPDSNTKLNSETSQKTEVNKNGSVRIFHGSQIVNAIETTIETGDVRQGASAAWEKTSIGSIDNKWEKGINTLDHLFNGPDPVKPDTTVPKDS